MKTGSWVILLNQRNWRTELICSIILAAGNSSRFNSQTPKQFLQLNGRLLLDYPIQTFSKCDEVDQLIIVVPEEKVNVIQEAYPTIMLSPAGKVGENPHSMD